MLGHGPEVFAAGMSKQRRPRRHVNLLSLGISMVFEQRLRVFPARQSTDSADGSVCHGVETLSRRVSKDSSLHVRSLDLASRGENLATRVDDRLRDIERVMAIFGESQNDDDLVLGRAVLNPPHLRRVDFKRIQDVLRMELGINRA